jgi:hypothetical protein
MATQGESFVSGNIKSWSCDFNPVVTAGQICAFIAVIYAYEQQIASLT